MSLLVLTHPNLSADDQLAPPACAPLGLFANPLHENGCPVECRDLHSTSWRPADLNAFTGLIVLGGPQSANDSSIAMRNELRLVEGAINVGLPVFGVCLGAQIIARVLGATVGWNPEPEIGWHTVRPKPAAAADPLFFDFEEQPVFHWHRETFELPAGATLLLESDACRHQGFRYGDRVWAVQFHPEVDPAIIQEWCVLDERCGDQRELTHQPDPFFRAAELRAFAKRLIGRWTARMQSQ